MKLSNLRIVFEKMNIWYYEFKFVTEPEYDLIKKVYLNIASES
jgi:hypothetical protein